ncbi:hypothetical protein F4778DRAFT_717358 [Xylariomycetidae sp. FL2044]|nr:hypothetical protein F4778DRAFT_717358 [Xylariomycetidae sp. FL2044]
MDRRVAVTPDNMGPIVSLVTWITEAAVLIAVAVKLTLSSIIPGKRNAEDIVLFLATAFSIGFTICISLAVPNGIGVHLDTLSQHQLEQLQKAVYSGGILLVLVSGCVQVSVLFLLRGLTPDPLHHRVTYAAAGFVVLFFIPFFFVAVFPCQPSRVWELLGGQCIDQILFWEAYAAISIAIETFLVLFPVFIIYPLQMARGRKAIVISCFATRVLVIGALAAQLSQARSLKSQHLDPTFHAWKYLLTTVLVQGVSIITVCIPYIRNLFLGMESGMIQTGHFRLPSRHDPENGFALEPISSGKISTTLSGQTDTMAKEPETYRGEINDQN